MCQLKPPSINLNDNTLISQQFICTTFNGNHVDIIYLVIVYDQTITSYIEEYLSPLIALNFVSPF